MAEVTLLFSPALSQIDTIVLDATVSELHTIDSEITEHPVEEGAAVADHHRAKPDVITLEGIISNTPINRGQSRRVASSFGESFETTADQDAIAGQPGYAEQAYLALKDLRDTSKLVSVITPLRTYESMLLQTVTIPRNVKTGDALRFTAVLKQVRLVKNKTTTQTVAAEPKAHKKTSTGKQSAKELTGGDGEAKRSSWARGLSDSAGLSSMLGLP
jgi:hypothetical protein